MRNKMAKRSIAVILSLVLALSGLPVFGNVEAKAEVGYAFNEGIYWYFIYQDDDEGHKVTLSCFLDEGYDYGADLDGLELPDTALYDYNNTVYSVTRISSLAFFAYRSIKGLLKLPNKLEEIGKEAFADCDGLTGKLILPDTLKIIGDSAFSACIGLEGELVIPKNVNVIGDGAFAMDNFSSISFEDDSELTKIGKKAFAACYELEGKLVIPKKVSIIDDAAFEYCTGLTGDLIIPDNVIEIGTSAFQNCSGFTGDLKIPNSVTSIGDSAFADCINIDGTLTIPASVTSIGSDAFKNMHPDIIINNTDIDLTTKGIDFTNYAYFEAIKDSEGKITAYTKATTATKGTYYIKKTFDDSNIVELDKTYFPTAAEDDQTATIKPRVIVKETSTSEALIEGVDYDIYTGNHYWGAANTPIFTIGPVISGIKRFSGQITNNGDVFEYKIYGDISSDSLVMVQPIPDQKYQGGTPIKPDFTVTCKKNGETIPLVLGTDYEIVGYYDNTEPGTASVKIKGIGDFVKEREITFNIVKGDNPATVVSPLYVEPNGKTINLSKYALDTVSPILSYRIMSDSTGECSVNNSTGLFTSGTVNGSCRVSLFIEENDSRKYIIKLRR